MSSHATAISNSVQAMFLFFFFGEVLAVFQRDFPQSFFCQSFSFQLCFHLLFLCIWNLFSNLLCVCVCILQFFEKIERTHMVCLFSMPCNRQESKHWLNVTVGIHSLLDFSHDVKETKK